MYGHEKRARKLVCERLEERGLSATEDQKFEMALMAVDREIRLFYCLDASVDYAITVVLGLHRGLPA